MRFFLPSLSLTPLLALALGLAGCLDTKPKTLGMKRVTFGDNDTDTPSNFKFNFAFLDTAATAPLNNVVFLQGAPDTKSTMLSTCNSSGTSCVCEFYNSANVKIDETAAADITYDITGNYYRCVYDGASANTTISYVKIRNQNSSVVSDIYSIVTPATMTLAKLLGPNQDIGRARSISRYSCLFNFLQKQGTTSNFFDCSTQGSLCSGVGDPAGDFCLLQSRFPYYLYSDSVSNNNNVKVPDEVYNQGGSNTICGIQLKKFDCVDTALTPTPGGTPVLKFGLYQYQTGVFTVPVSLQPGPNYTAELYGYAAATTTFLGNTICPPGLERQIFYTATTAMTAVGPSHNYTEGLELKEVAAPTATPASVTITKLVGGDCNNTTCTLPTAVTLPAPPPPFPYVTTGTEFCVIPKGLL